jgi:hypothetical protein
LKLTRKKIKATLSIPRTNFLKDIKWLTACVAGVSRFVSRLGEKTIPLYQILKKSDDFV